jgi:hypothetical protein
MTPPAWLWAQPLHSPAFFMLVLPFTFIPFHYAAITWLILGHLLLFISLWLILKALKDRPTAEDIAVTGFLVFSFWPLMEQAHLMQPNFVILLFLSLFLYLLKKDSMFAAGLCLGIAVLVREYLAVSVLFILWKRNWRALAGSVTSVLLLKSASLLVFGAHIEVSYWKYILDSFGKGVHLSMNNLSLAASVLRLGKPYISATACLLIVLAFTFLSAGMAFFWTRKKDTSELLGFSLFLTLCFIVSPWVHECHYVALYIPLLIAWFSLEDAKREALYWLFIPAYLLLGLKYNLIGFPRFHSGLWSIFTTGKIMGLAILFMLLGKLINCRVSGKTQQHNVK